MGIKVIVGLGNPGKKYEITRHNTGFLMLNFLAKKYSFSDWKLEKKFFGEICMGAINNQKIIFLKPQTFMNLSGKSIRMLQNFYKLDAQDFLIFTDDLDLEFGITRWREKGSCGGHNGLRDIIRVFGSSNFFRIKIGIANENRSIIPAPNFVLQPLLDKEISALNSVFEEGETKMKLNFLKNTTDSKK